MLDLQHQRVDIPAHARNAHNGLLQKRLERGSGRGSLLNHPSCPSNNPIGQGTELNCSCHSHACMSSFQSVLNRQTNLKTSSIKDVQVPAREWPFALFYVLGHNLFFCLFYVSTGLKKGEETVLHKLDFYRVIFCAVSQGLTLSAWPGALIIKSKQLAWFDSSLRVLTEKGWRDFLSSFCLTLTLTSVIILFCFYRLHLNMELQSSPLTDYCGGIFETGYENRRRCIYSCIYIYIYIYIYTCVHILSPPKSDLSVDKYIYFIMEPWTDNSCNHMKFCLRQLFFMFCLPLPSVCQYFWVIADSWSKALLLNTQQERQ